MKDKKAFLIQKQKSHLCPHELSNIMLKLKMHIDGSIETSGTATAAAIEIQSLHSFGLDAIFLTHAEEIIRSNVQHGLTHTLDVQVVALYPLYRL